MPGKPEPDSAETMMKTFILIKSLMFRSYQANQMPDWKSRHICTGTSADFATAMMCFGKKSCSSKSTQTPI